MRMYDQSRPVALYCSENHLDLIKQSGLEHYFQALNILPEENRSVIGFKHNIYKFMPFKENLFLDSDILWCRNPDKLWKLLSPYRFTITGTQKADIFFGGPKGVAIALDFLLNRRKRTLEKFNLTYLSRVQAGMIYSADRDLTESVCRRSEEHTSELQSRGHLVCRLLLEKKKKQQEDSRGERQQPARSRVPDHDGGSATAGRPGDHRCTVHQGRTRVSRQGETSEHT